MKKLILIIVVIMMFGFNVEVKAETLRSLKNKLDTALSDLTKAEKQTNLTTSEIAQTKQNIKNIRNTINNISKEMVNLTNEITKLEVDIEAKDEEIKRIMNYVQVSSGENAYLEYAFGAQDFTDFIYRASVAEQLSKYNDKLIQEFTQMIKDNKTKQEQLKVKQANMEKEQVKLGADLLKLNDRLNALSDETMSIEDEIKMQKEIIKVYEDRGCKLDEDIRSCGMATLPTTTQLYRPIVSGKMTSDFGERTYKLHGKWVSDFHSGVDLSQSGTVKVYSAGIGMVAGITHRSSCGGNRVYVQHKLKNGVTYTTSYVHLRSINVKQGQLVTRDTVIGIMGGASSEWWDRCSSGQHLHFSIAKGLYLTDYSNWNTYTSKQINPALLINFPNGLYIPFYDRITRY